MTTDVDPWREKVVNLIWGEESKDGITLNEVLESLGVPLERRNRTEGGRVHAIIRELKLDRRQVLDDEGAKKWKYFTTTEKPPALPEPETPEPEPTIDDLQMAWYAAADARDDRWRAWWNEVAEAAGLRQSWFDEHLPPPDRRREVLIGTCRVERRS